MSRVLLTVALVAGVVAVAQVGCVDESTQEGFSGADDIAAFDVRPGDVSLWGFSPWESEDDAKKKLTEYELIRRDSPWKREYYRYEGSFEYMEVSYPFTSLVIIGSSPVFREEDPKVQAVSLDFDASAAEDEGEALYRMFIGDFKKQRLWDFSQEEDGTYNASLEGAFDGPEFAVTREGGLVTATMCTSDVTLPCARTRIAGFGALEFGTEASAASLTLPLALAPYESLIQLISTADYTTTLEFIEGKLEGVSIEFPSGGFTEDSVQELLSELKAIHGDEPSVIEGPDSTLELDEGEWTTTWDDVCGNTCELALEDGKLMLDFRSIAWYEALWERIPWTPLA